MFVADNSPRPVPAQRHCISLDELLSLRHWPPARSPGRQRMAIREGHHLSHIRGRGMEYDDVREYQPGDDIRHLDWRLMARTGEAHTKLYREERERPVFVLADLRPPMFFATQGHYKSVLASYAAAMTIWTTLANGDRVGGQILGAGSEQLFRPSSNRQQVMAMMAALERSSACAEAGLNSNKPDNTASSLSLADVLAGADRYISSGTLLYIFSDFHDVDEAVQQHLMRLAQRCELKLVLISDPLEQQLPQGKRYRFFGSGRELLVDADQQQQQRYQQQFQARIELLERLRNLRGVEFAHWQTHHHPLFRSPLMQEMI
ncbi:DUF58 domain-containing protein [Neptunomonas qingdaonensis]|uniref:DUF58 domain-containing protein n=1 Tax=Neptunomonas qingdaonensis TaxID=1045558 RepID=A0A1I2VDM3_9GAMM|nr:DUF58 domain-containing protein [Neptunomonas qingdaonensis]SFG86257.1 Protein of unknown function DUF58 [Neptunomonas qingdaonensis]